MKLTDVSDRVGRAIARKPWPVLAIFTVLTVLSLFLAQGIRINTAIEDMLPKGNPVATNYVAITDAFETTSNLIVAVEAKDRQSLIAGAERFAAELKNDANLSPLVRNVRMSMDRDFIAKWGLMLSKTDELLDRESMFEDTRLVPFLRSTNDLLEDALSDGEESVDSGDEEDDLVRLMTGFEMFASDFSATLDPLEYGMDEAGMKAAANTLADDLVLGERFMVDAKGTTLLLIVTPTFDLGDRKNLIALADGARAVGNRITAQTPGVTYTYTGDVASEADEERSLGADATYPSLVAFGIIFALFLFSFNKARSIVFALITLAVGIIIDLGFAALAVGELNMITSSFGAILVGLGIDFGIHLSSRYDKAVGSGESGEEAMGDTFRRVFVPVFIGGLTTAGAFYSLIFSGSMAFRQFGLIAGTGIVTCLLATFGLLPALLSAFPEKNRALAARKPRRKISFLPLARLGMLSGRNKGVVIAAFAVLCVIAGIMVPANGFEFDFRAIGPVNTEAKRAESMIGERFRISTCSSMAAVGSLDEARTLAEKAATAPLVRGVETLGDYLPSPSEQEARKAIIRRIAMRHKTRVDGNWDTADTEGLLAEIQRLEWNLIEFADLSAASSGEGSLAVAKRDAMIREIRGAETLKPGAEAFKTLMDKITSASETKDGMAFLGLLNAAFAEAMDASIDRMCDIDRLMTENDIPGEILADLRSQDGKSYLVSINPTNGLKGDDALIKFARGLTDLDPRITGSLQMGLEFSKTTLEEAKKSAILIATFFLILVYLGFRSVKMTAIVTVNLAVGMLFMFGIYPLVGRFNIVSILAMPLVIGMGIDYGVHVASSYVREREIGGNDIERLALEDSSKPIALSALTTIIGFGSLALVASFKAVMDLGIVLLLGIFFCFITTYTLLPALMALGRKTPQVARVGDKIKEVS